MRIVGVGYDGYMSLGWSYCEAREYRQATEMYRFASRCGQATSLQKFAAAAKAGEMEGKLANDFAKRAADRIADKYGEAIDRITVASIIRQEHSIQP